MKEGTLNFRARARTIEHLGKGQIADCPTAVSELWKNAYDAYARNVALYTLDGDYPCGAIIDNGCGMTAEQIEDSWLVVGTESKKNKRALPEKDRFGLSIRQTQGEKGIGRLSAAFLSPVIFLVSKKIDTSFSALLIDWRLFENPYLSFEDVIIPSAEFNNIDDVANVFISLQKKLENNIYIYKENKKLVKSNWAKFRDDELPDLEKEYASEIVNLNDKEQKDLLISKTTFGQIKDFCFNCDLNEELFVPWKKMLKDVAKPDGNSHGTALFFPVLSRDLTVLTKRDEIARSDYEYLDVDISLVDTLRAFINPYLNVDDIKTSNFNYEIYTVNKKNATTEILRQFDVFNDDDFNTLEHKVEGYIDEKGWFKGHVTAFGINKGEVIIPPSINVGLQSKVGPVHLKIGAFEPELPYTSLEPSIHATIVAKTERYSGLMIFRDNLRVLPYGRVDNDFFGIEEARSKNAGRSFWSFRRMFGGIEISHKNNKELIDKSGREGFIRNQASRQFQTLVSNILSTTALKFFGSGSEDRQEIIEILKKDKANRKNAQEAARKSTQKSFREALKKQEPELEKALTELYELKNKLESIQTYNRDIVERVDTELRKLDSIRTDIKTPVKPPKIGVLEEKYRAYRDKYNDFTVSLINMRAVINKIDSELHTEDLIDLAKKHLVKNQNVINAKLNKLEGIIANKIEALRKRWSDDFQIDRSNYYRRTIEIVDGLTGKEDKQLILNNLDIVYYELVDEYTFKYNNVISTLERIGEGISLESAFSVSEEEKLLLEDKVKKLNSVAQLGISVEIVAHELEQMDSLVTRGLNSLPSDIKKHSGYELAFNSHKSLTEKLRFLSPLKVSGYQKRVDITGKQIHNHIIRFFGDRFERQRAQIYFTPAFDAFSITDVQSRIYPVFINIINNALYWVGLSEEREIKLDLIDNQVVIGNTGPAVDDDDVQHLFSLFYSKRANGHGVGLYLCRENLAVANHAIKYADISAGDPYLYINGANFIINFNGLVK